MGRQSGKLLAAAAVAVALAFTAIVPGVAGIATWKILLALIGLLLMSLAGPSRPGGE